MSISLEISKHQIARPPTPPHEHEPDPEPDFDLEACQTGLELLDSKHLVYNTPDDSPNSTTESMGKSSEAKSSKRVDFVLIPNHISKSKRKGGRIEELKPRRSILKSTSKEIPSDPPSSDILDSTVEIDVTIMLEHMIKGLASKDVSARYDAYMSINGCLKTYDDMPAKQSLAGKMNKLEGYIRRDLVVDTRDGVRTSQMVTEALKFVTSLCWFLETRSVMTAGFQVFLVAQSITILGKEDTPKSLGNLYLYMLSIQSFQSRVMSQEKVLRILAVLKSSAERIQGRQTTAHRIGIYKRLIGQAKPLMAMKASDWMEELINNMIIKTDEVRERAISAGFMAGQCYGSSSDVSVSQALSKLMNSQKTDDVSDKKYIDDVITRLQDWLDTKQNLLDIPSIWSIVVLLLRSRCNFPERWEHFKRWLSLIQGCLNNNDPRTRSEAYLAWIRLIYTISPKKDTSKSFSSLLFRPMKMQFERQEREKNTPVYLRKKVEGAYLTLLYYAFRPGSDFETLDRYWQEYIVPVFGQDTGLAIEESLGCRILISLISNNAPIWKLDRGLDTTNIISPDELPRIDAKWIRSRSKTITKILRIHLDKLKSEDMTNASWKRLWTTWIDAVRLAGAKEVKVSADTMIAMIEVLNIVRKQVIIFVADRNFNKIEPVLWIICYFYEQLGILPFLEERIVETGKDHDLEFLTDRTKYTNPRSALKILNELALSTIPVLNWIMANRDQPIAPSPSTLFCLSTIVKLSQAGYKTVSIELRHAVEGRLHSELLDDFEQILQDPPEDLRFVREQLSRFASWFNRCNNGSVSAELHPALVNNKSTPFIEGRQAFDTEEATEKYERECKTRTKGLISSKVTTPDPKSRRKRTTSPYHQQPRIRHDNSQIEFASIDSSPSILKAIDSELLTKRQREVKERQVTESDNLFRDISSSSGPKSRTENTPRLQLSGRDRVRFRTPELGSSSPILPPTESMVVFLDASPTPGPREFEAGGEILDQNYAAPLSSGGTSMMHFSIDDPPSSPPAEALAILETVESDVPFHLSDEQPDTKDVEMNITKEMLSESTPIQRSISPDHGSEIVNTLRSSPESEDDDLILSQIDRDLNYASQGSIMTESPKKQGEEPSSKKQKQERLVSAKTSPEKGRKRPSPGRKEVPQSKRIKITPDEGGISFTSEELVTGLKALLSKAKSGMTLSEGFEVLKMSAELTQLAVQAVQGHGAFE